LSFNNRGVLVQWDPTDGWSGRGWCRYGEVQKQTPLDEFFAEL